MLLDWHEGPRRCIPPEKGERQGGRKEGRKAGREAGRREAERLRDGEAPEPRPRGQRPRRCFAVAFYTQIPEQQVARGSALCGSRLSSRWKTTVVAL